MRVHCIYTHGNASVKLEYIALRPKGQWELEPIVSWAKHMIWFQSSIIVIF